MCSECGREVEPIHSYQMRRVRDLSLAQARVELDVPDASVRQRHRAPRTLRHILLAHEDRIVNHARYPIHTGTLEGVHNRIKVIKRQAYGFRDNQYFILKAKAGGVHDARDTRAVPAGVPAADGGVGAIGKDVCGLAREFEPSEGLVRPGEQFDPRSGSEFVKAHQAEFSVRAMCRVLGLSPSGYYTWLKRPPSARALRDAELARMIRQAHKDNRSVYGRPRIFPELKEQGERVGEKRVARLMRQEGIVGVSRRRRGPKTTKRNANARPAADPVERDFTAAGPDQLWVAHITYVPTWAGFLYLAVVLDAWSRRIVGWAMTTHRRPTSSSGMSKRRERTYSLLLCAHR